MSPKPVRLWGDKSASDQQVSGGADMVINQKIEGHPAIEIGLQRSGLGKCFCDLAQAHYSSHAFTKFEMLTFSLRANPLEDSVKRCNPPRQLSSMRRYIVLGLHRLERGGEFAATSAIGGHVSAGKYLL